jgi:hypothetical protein
MDIEHYDHDCDTRISRVHSAFGHLHWGCLGIVQSSSHQERGSVPVTPLSNKGRLRTAVFVPLIVAAVGVGWVAGNRLARNTDTVNANDPSTLPPSPSLTVISDLADGGHAYALHWRNADELWYLDSGSDGSLTLVRYFVPEGSTKSWLVPLAATQTPYTFLTEDKDGNLWLAANYSIAAFDPKSEQYLAAWELDRRPPETDPSAGARVPFDGTWIADFESTAKGEILLVRHNVDAVFSASLPGTLKAVQVLQQPPTELRSIGGQLLPAVQENDDVMMLDSGERLPFKSVGSSGCRLDQAFGGAGSTLREEADSKELAGALLIAPDDPIATNGRLVAIAIGNSGSIVSADCSNGKVATAFLGDSTVLPDGGELDFLSRSQRLVRRAESLAISDAGLVAAGLTSNQVALLR